ncbi:MAG: membrane protein insertase YidC [Caldilineaceae bacterium]|nr:membrane protein insertase YidC [Caldilineaceae bacterium]
MDAALSFAFMRRYKVKRKHLLLILLLVATMLLLGGCGVPREGVDVATTPPEGLWQQLAVWPLANALIWLNDFINNMAIPYSWGFAIILFTIIIKVITFPLTMTQIRGMQAQRELQPKLQELQKKYGKDREKLAQEQMKLYQEAGVNPLGGCLPLVIQMPVLFGLYSALVALGPRLNDAHFFWIPDLGFPHFTEGLTWIPTLFNEGSYGMLAGYLILPALLMVSQVFMQKYMTPTPPAGGDGQNKMMTQMTTMMTLMFGFFTLQVPAGLTLYWVTSNLLQMGQQSFIMRGSATPAASTAASGKGAASAVSATPSATNGAKDESSSANGAVNGSADKPVRKPSRRQRKKR